MFLELCLKVLALLISYILLMPNLSYSEGTIKNIQEIFTGRCYEYQRIVHNVKDTQFKNCTVVWEKIAKAFAYKDPCKVNETDYADFMDYVDEGEETEESGNLGFAIQVGFCQSSVLFVGFCLSKSVQPLKKVK